MRLALTDPAGNRIAGDPLTTSDAAKRPIRFQGRTVGNLVLRGLPGDRNGIDAAFLAAQGETMLMIGFVSILLCLLLSWLLARQITKPLAALSANVQRIAEGRLDSRISIHGDDEIGDLGRAVNAMADGLASAEEIRRAWISDASHELRTPLAVLQAEIEAIEDQVREPNEATMARLHKQVRQLTHLVDDLRATLDPDLGIERLEPRAVDLPALLAEAVTLFRERFHNAGLGLEWQPAATPIPPFIGDAGRLTQIFTNLLENSLRYSREGGKLRVNLTCDRQFVTLRFDDTPPAPPASALPLLFNRFYRVEPSRSRALGGSGLGLAICKALVEAHRGVIAASESELGGLCITIRLPLATP